MMNSHSFFRSFKDEQAEKLEEGIMVASLSVHDHEVRQMFFDAGPRIPSHRHSKDVVTLVLEGHLEMTVGSETRTVGPGELFLVPENTDHHGLVLGNRVVAYSFSQD
jgi:quercetin dioxygenase-like cupin family protein